MASCYAARALRQRSLHQKMELLVQRPNISDALHRVWILTLYQSSNIVYEPAHGTIGRTDQAADS